MELINENGALRLKDLQVNKVDIMFLISELLPSLFIWISNLDLISL